HTATTSRSPLSLHDALPIWVPTPPCRPLRSSSRFARMPTYTSLPGFRDFYPADFAVRAHITSTWRETARRYGFEEYDGPPLEARSEEHTSELQSRENLVCRL